MKANNKTCKKNKVMSVQSRILQRCFNELKISLVAVDINQEIYKRSCTKILNIVDNVQSVPVQSLLLLTPYFASFSVTKQTYIY